MDSITRSTRCVAYMCPIVRIGHRVKGQQDLNGGDHENCTTAARRTERWRPRNLHAGAGETQRGVVSECQGASESAHGRPLDLPIRGH